MRRIVLNLEIAWRSLAGFKMRSVLAVLGVFLGTFSLVLVSNVSRSLVVKTEQEIAKLGKNLLIVQSGRIHRFGRKTLFSGANNMTLQDAAAIAGHIEFVTRVSAASNGTFPVRFRHTVLASVLVTGVLPNYNRVRSFYPARGRFISALDQKYGLKVVVLGRRIAEKLFHDQDPVGRYVLVRRAPCQVIGVMEAKGADVSGVDQDNQIFMPLKTFLRRFVHRTFVSTLYVQVRHEPMLAAVRKEIEVLLRRRHHIKPGDRDDFTVVDLKDVNAMKMKAVRLITILGRIAAGISFIIGGIGILSIMILMVNERRLEIGIRRAVGSRRRDIVLQFLLESGFISLTGGAIGVVAGFSLSLLVFKWFHFPVVGSWSALIAAFLASVTIGVVAGIYPSQKAIAIQPMDVIRSS